MKKIELKNGEIAMVSDIDFEKVSEKKWYLVSGYAARHRKMVNGKRGGFIYMHREIAGAESGQEVDHINCDRLDNRRENLRVCTRAENNRNVGIRKDNKTGVKGVVVNKKSGKFVVQIWADRKKRVYVGEFSTILEAKKARETAASKYHGEYARM